MTKPVQICFFLGACLNAFGQSSDWTMLNVDYTGRRYRPLTQIGQSNVASLRRAWEFQRRHGD
jgi:glucose dehydrogenase